jgi:polysaccharide pyruvyl transferase WcaK-like protein
MKELPINLDRLFSSIRHHAAGAGASVRLIALSSHPDEDDGTSLELLHEHLSPIPCELVSRSTVSPKQLWRAISECSAFLTVRLHGAITAYLTDVPFVLYEYHRKCSDFVDDIRQADSLRWPIEDPNGPDIAALLAHSPTPSLAPSDYARRSDLNFVAAPWADR